MSDKLNVDFVAAQSSMSKSVPAARKGDLPNLKKEIALLEQGYRFIAGLDEAGRGAWAGPVVAAVVILPVDRLNSMEALAGLDDSKRLNQKRRERFFELIRETALGVSIGQASAVVVDEVNVIGATRCAMQRALAQLSPAPDYLLIDHLKLPAVDLPQQAFPRADRISLTVAAASVMAKVTRDRLMVQFSAQYPAYAFDRHKGYGTTAHRLALAKHGPCPLHRMSYRPLKGFEAREEEIKIL